MTGTGQLSTRIRMSLLTALVALGPLQWIDVGTSELAVRPSHIPMFLLASIGLFDLFSAKVKKDAVQYIFPFLFSYFLYLAALAISAAILDQEFNKIIKYSIYGLSALGIYLALLQLSIADFMKSAFLGSIFAAVSFVLIAKVTLDSRGIDLFRSIGNAIVTGNTKILQFHIFIDLFNDNLDDPYSFTKTSLRNTLIGFFVITFCISSYTFLMGKWRIAAGSTALISALTILVSVSRSNIIVLLLVCLVPSIIFLKNRPAVGILTMVALFFLTFSLSLALDLSGFIEIIDNRFSNLDSDGRIDMFELAFQKINSNPIFGSGFGSEIELVSGKDIIVHNLFLNSWISSGIFGLLPAMAFIVSMLIFYFRRISEYSNSHSELFIIGMLTLPLFRSQISGDGGNFTAAEWTSIAFVASYFYLRKYEKSGSAIPLEVVARLKRKTRGLGKSRRSFL